MLFYDGVDGLGTYSAPVDVASDAVCGHIGERAVALWHADAGLSEVDAIYPEVLEGRVGGDVRGRQRCRQGNERRPHGFTVKGRFLSLL